MVEAHDGIGGLDLASLTGPEQTRAVADDGNLPQAGVFQLLLEVAAQGVLGRFPPAATQSGRQLEIGPLQLGKVFPQQFVPRGWQVVAQFMPEEAESKEGTGRLAHLPGALVGAERFTRIIAHRSPPLGLEQMCFPGKRTDKLGRHDISRPNSIRGQAQPFQPPFGLFFDGGVAHDSLAQVLAP